MKTKLSALLAGEPLNGLKRYKQELETQDDAQIILDLETGYTNFPSDHLPDLLFLNYSRNELFGLDLLRKIKRTYPSILVVMAVEPGQIKIGRHALNRGALAYIIKGEHELQQVKTIMNLAQKKLRKTAVQPRRQYSVFRMMLQSWRLLFQMS